jgi:hypothetical protein
MGNSCSNKRIPLRFIVASRPESHTREVFDSAAYFGYYHSFNVEQLFDDVRTYLRDESSRIHRERTMAFTRHRECNIFSSSAKELNMPDRVRARVD